LKNDSAKKERGKHRHAKGRIKAEYREKETGNESNGQRDGHSIKEKRAEEFRK
jgi:hypothetical protein